MNIDNDQRVTIINQIGKMNVLAISGGIVHPLPDGIELPVGCGYKVRVRLNASDYYDVERVFRRNGVDYPKGTEKDVDCFQVGETAYRASCFRNDDAEYWPAALDSAGKN